LKPCFGRKSPLDRVYACPCGDAGIRDSGRYRPRFCPATVGSADPAVDPGQLSGWNSCRLCEFLCDGDGRGGDRESGRPAGGLGLRLGRLRSGSRHRASAPLSGWLLQCHGYPPHSNQVIELEAHVTPPQEVGGDSRVGSHCPQTWTRQRRIWISHIDRSSGEWTTKQTRTSCVGGTSNAERKRRVLGMSCRRT
jgi:hypothetical protein